ISIEKDNKVTQVLKSSNLIMPREFSEDLRWRVAYLHADGYNNKDIAKILYISKSTVYRIIRNFQKWRYVKPPFKGQTGRRKAFK
ncbi:11003_t:CDS:2, partial [Scutellospora calospora]